MTDWRKGKDCNCVDLARFDINGNLTILYTCKSCLEQALENLRDSVCNQVPCMVQLMLLDEDGRLVSSAEVGSFYERQDGPPEALI